jgi:hypothetical protein
MKKIEPKRSTLKASHTPGAKRWANAAPQSEAQGVGGAEVVPWYVGGWGEGPGICGGIGLNFLAPTVEGGYTENRRFGIMEYDER